MFARNSIVADKSDVLVVIGSSLAPSPGTMDTIRKAAAQKKPIIFWDVATKRPTYLDEGTAFWPQPDSLLPQVISKYSSEFDANDSTVVNIMRGSTFGNPYKIGVDGDRDQVIELFRQFQLPKIMKTPQWQDLMHKWVYGGGVKLGCCCAPKPCHGDVIAQAMKDNLMQGWKPPRGYMQRPDGSKYPDLTLNHQAPPATFGTPLHDHLQQYGGQGDLFEPKRRAANDNIYDAEDEKYLEIYWKALANSR